MKVRLGKFSQDNSGDTYPILQRGGMRKAHQTIERHNPTTEKHTTLSSHIKPQLKSNTATSGDNL